MSTQTVIIEGVNVGTDVLEAYADPKCSCQKGHLVVTRDGKTCLDVCLCAARRYYHEVILPSRQEQTAVIRVRAKEQEASWVARKLTRLGEALRKSEESVAEAQARVDAAIAERQSEYAAAEVALADTHVYAREAAKHAASLAAEEEDLTQQIHVLTTLREQKSELRQSWLCEAARLHEVAHDQEALVARASERVDAATRKVAGTLFRDERTVEKLRRRIADTKARHPDVLSDVNPAAPGGEEIPIVIDELVVGGAL